MKKLLFALMCVLSFVSCSDSSSSSEQSPDTTPVTDRIVGEWVYDRPSEGVWETMKFTSSGIFYYSNVDAAWKISNTKNDGRYYVNGNDVKGTYFLNGTAQELDITIKKISDYALTALFNNIGLSFTYARLIDTKHMKPEETYTPNYSVLVRSEIIGYSSHNPKVASVDATTGKITAVSSGHTYIDVVTQDGTAVVEIISFDEDKMFDDFDYPSMLKKSVPEVVDEIGPNYIYKDNHNGVIYLSDSYVVDTVKYYTGVTDDTHVEYISLCLNSNVTSNKVLTYLKKKYEMFYDKNGLYGFSTDRMVESQMMMVIFDENTWQVSFGLMEPESKWDDFSSLFGKTDVIVYNEMKTLGYNYLFTDNSYSNDGSDYYSINNNSYISMVGFVFNPKKVMCEYWVYLNSDVDYREIYNELNANYTLNTNESSNSKYVFYDKSKRLKIQFMADGAISYTDTTQDPFVAPKAEAWPDFAKGIGMTHQQILAEYGNSPYENTDEDIIYFITNEYISLYEFLFNKTTNLVYVVAALVKDGINPSKIVEILNAQYTPFANGTLEDGSQYAWINSSSIETATIGILYDVNNRIIQYLDLTSNSNASKYMVKGKGVVNKLHPTKSFKKLTIETKR